MRGEAGPAGSFLLMRKPRPVHVLAMSVPYLPLTQLPDPHMKPPSSLMAYKTHVIWALPASQPHSRRATLHAAPSLP